MLSYPVRTGTVWLLWLALGTLAAPASAQEAPKTIEPGASCVSSSCHADLAPDASKVVHPAAEGGDSCENCHLPSGEENQHAFELADDQPALCFMCHDDMTEGMESVHPPVADGMCTTCHNPHQSDNPRMLEMPINELCVSCHADKPFTGDKVTHGPVAEGRCIACHDPHAGHNPKMLRKTQPELCFDCHDRQQRDPSGTPLPPAKAMFTAPNMKLHPPFGSGECTMCHLPHSGPNFRLLIAPYPATFYSPYSEDAYMCFQCHDSEAFASPRTLDATQFRNGNLNLHYRHVNREKGRTCRACHHHHGSDRDMLIRERVPFGKRFITISEFKLTPTGGTCAPLCHAKVTYDRFDPAPVPFKVTKREGKDASPEELNALKAEFEREQKSKESEPGAAAEPTVAPGQTEPAPQGAPKQKEKPAAE